MSERISIHDGCLTEETVKKLLNAMIESGKTAYIDWDNSVITITGNVMEDNGVIMSDGLPLKCWPVIFQIRDASYTSEDR